MSAIARLFLACGRKDIVGVDSSRSELVEALEKEGMKQIATHGDIEI